MYRLFSKMSFASSFSLRVGAPGMSPWPTASTIAVRTPGWFVPEDQRSPGTAEVDVTLSVGVPDMTSVLFSKTKGVKPPTGSGTRGRGELTPPGKYCCAPLEQGFRIACVTYCRISRNEVILAVTKVGRISDEFGSSTTKAHVHKLTPPQKQALKNFLKYRLQMNKGRTSRAGPSGS